MSRTDVRRFSIYIPARWSEKHFSEKWAIPLLPPTRRPVQTSVSRASGVAPVLPCTRVDWGLTDFCSSTGLVDEVDEVVKACLSSWP